MGTGTKERDDVFFSCCWIDRTVIDGECAKIKRKKERTNGCSKKKWIKTNRRDKRLNGNSV